MQKISLFARFLEQFFLFFPKNLRYDLVHFNTMYEYCISTNKLFFFSNLKPELNGMAQKLKKAINRLKHFISKPQHETQRVAKIAGF